jgi:hypothetical protein
MATGLAACNDEGATNAGNAAVEPGSEEIAADTSSDTGSGDESAAGMTDEEATPEGRISSGAFELKPTPTTAERPQAPAGVRRIVPLEEALAGAPFVVMEPSVLPEDTHRDVVHLESPQEGETNPALPAVRFVYTLAAGGAMVLYQHPATGEPGAGDEVDINGNTGWAVEGETPLVTWEQDGVRLELRGDTDLDTLLAAARSMVQVEEE